MARLLIFGVAALAILLAPAASAHKPSDSYLSLAVGDALGMDVYGVDVVVSAGEHFIVDVSAFPDA